MRPTGKEYKYKFAIAAAVLAMAAPTADTVTPAQTGAPDTRPDPDACTLLSSMDLEPLLLSGEGGVIDGYNYYPAPGMVTCKWFAQPNNHAADAVRRTTMLAFYHIADPRRAQAQLDRQPRGDTRLSLAITGRGDDAVARPSPTIVVARHGADVAVIDAGGADLADPDQIETRYLLDALALKAAGAAVKPPPWAEPRDGAKMIPLAPTGSLAGWMAPPRAVPAGAGALEPLIFGLKLVAEWRFGLMMVLMPLAVIPLVIGQTSRRARQTPYADLIAEPKRARHRWPGWLAGSLIAAMVLNMLFGADVATRLIDRYGETGAAIVTGRYATSTQYNRHDVIGYRVLIGMTDRRVVPGEFRTDDFNVLGLGDTIIYPSVGDVFTVHYLPHHPQQFVIRNDDQGPWARKLACARLTDWHDEAARKMRAAPADPSFRAELSRAANAERDGGCSR